MACLLRQITVINLCNIFISGNKLLAYRYDPLVSKRLVLDKNINGSHWNVTVDPLINKIMSKMEIRHHIYICDNGEYVSLTLVNDNLTDCKSGEDETSISCFIHGKIKNDSLCKTSCLRPSCTCDDLYYHSIGGGCLPYNSKCGTVCNITGLQYDTMFSYTQINFHYEEDVNENEFVLIRDNKLQSTISSHIKSDCTHEELTCKDKNKSCFVTKCQGNNELQCKYGCGRCFPFHKLCVYELDYNGNLMYCYSGSHLKWCRNVDCNNMFKCYKYYCVPYR